jgi:tetratricopeptide (TPR) repeat protein
VAAVFARALEHGFVYDDFQYVVSNPALQQGLSLDVLGWALTARFASNWHPLTWISHAVDVQLFGFDPRGHHAVSIALHAVNAVLLFLVLLRLTGVRVRAASVAALFAIHPLHVESVAWVSERKDLLSALFVLLTIAAYRRYAARPGPGRYLAVAGLFCLALAAKPMAVTLPLLLLLLDFWPLGRVRAGASIGRLFAEKAPLLLLSAASSWLTVLAQREGGSMRSVHQYALAVRAGNAALACLAYLRDLVLPTGLSPFYPHPGADLSAWQAGGAALLIALATAAALGLARRLPWLTIGWLWYLVSLVPVIGIVQVGDQARADRYTYLPLVGPFLVAAWGCAALAAPRHRLRRLLPAAAIAALGALAIGAAAQARWWESQETLFRRALAVTRDNWFAHLSLAAALAAQGDLEGASSGYRSALAIRPNDPILHNNLGFILGRSGRIDEAMAAFAEASRLKPDYAEPIFNTGVLCLKRNDVACALERSAALDRVDRAWADRLREFVRIRQGGVPAQSPP